MELQITADDIKCLKSAEDIVLTSHHGERSLITCLASDEIYHQIEVGHVIIDNEGGQPPKFAALIVENVQTEEVWRSIVAILEPEDRIKIRWCRGTYTQPIMLSRNLVGDGVEIEVEGDQRRLVFLLLVHVAEKDSKTRIFHDVDFESAQFMD
jgi:hypothetical protein